MDITLCMYGQWDAGDERHPQQIIKDLGIQYTIAVPQSISDSWWFLKCSNIPEELPSYLKLHQFDYDNIVGYGISKEDADKLKAPEM